MAIKNILVAYNGLTSSETALAGAVQMQQHYDAHITGLFAHGGSSVSNQIKPWMPKKVQTAIKEVSDDRHPDIKGRFDAICAEVPADKRHWIDSDGPVQRTVSNYARLYDVTVIGMHENTKEYGQSHIEIYPDRVTFDSGRPVIIFPAGCRKNIFSGRTVVAWDGKRAAARALADAIHILGSGDAVEIVSVGKSPLAGSLPGLDVSMVLDRHDLNVSLKELPRDRRSIAETLMSHCEAVGAGMLVMGAYEHSPLREGLMGGVTHDIAQRAKIPVLMSH